MKARRQELEEQWKALRRGWYVGGESFGQRLGRWLDKAMAGRQRGSHSGPARQAHDQRAAGALLELGLKALGLEESGLSQMPKGALEKTALAWWLRERTTAGLGWIAQGLEMGHASRVSQAVSRMRHHPSRRLKLLRRALGAVELDERCGRTGARRPAAK
jgi:hypothetical protein